MLSLKLEPSTSPSGESGFMEDRNGFYFLQEERDRETYHRLCAMDILSTISCICPNAIRTFILEGPMPKPYVQGALFGGIGVFRSYNSDISESRYPSHVDIMKESFKGIVLATQKHNSKCLLYVIIARLLTETNEMIVEHIGDTLHSILDPECRTDSVADRERFAVLFNESYLPWLAVCFLEHHGLHGGNSARPPVFSTGGANTIHQSLFMTPYLNSAIFYSSTRVVAEALCFCTIALGYRMKYFVMKNQLVNKALIVLLGAGQKAVYLHAIKFVFSIVKINDEMNFKQWVKNDTLKPIFELMAALSGRDNLIISAITELIDFIRMGNMKVLIEYIVEKHADSFANVVYQGETFDKLCTKYSQMKDAEVEMANQSAPGFPQAFRDNIEASRRAKFQLQSSEESYFEDEDEMDEDVSKMSALLETYASDDDGTDNEIGPKPQAENPRSGQEEETSLSADLLDDTPADLDIDEDASKHKLKKRRLSSIGGYLPSSPPDKIRVIATSEDNEIFPGGRSYGVPAGEAEAKSAESFSSPVCPPDAAANTLDNDDVSPPLPPLRSKYDSDSDEEDTQSAFSANGKSFVNKLFKRSSNQTSVSSSISEDTKNKGTEVCL